MNKIKIEEVVVVEGRDDTQAVKKAVDAETIETHGFGISLATWKLLEKAYSEKGIIIFTDPDYSGEEIRRKLLKKFPDAKEAFLSREEATAGDDIGIENAAPQAITEALGKVCTQVSESVELFSMQTMYDFGLAGESDSADKRHFLGKELGIGYGNAKAFLRKLNRYGVSRERFEAACRKMVRG